MTIEERALLEAIWDEPDDDTARLVYADWLEENGRTDYADAIRRGVRKPKRFTFGVGQPAVVSYTSERPESRGEIVRVQLADPEPWAQWNVWKGTVERVQLSWLDWLDRSDRFAMLNPVPEVWLTDRPNVANLITPSWDKSYREFGIPGRTNRCRVNDGEDPIRVVLRAEFPWVRRWNYPLPLAGALVVPHGDTIPDDIGDAVLLADGRKGVLASRIGPGGYALVDFSR